MEIALSKVLQGSILDIGGGGEGIIGRVYGSQVIAIDNCQEELDEAPDGVQKLLMDARKLLFDAETFDQVTCFYSLMYMDREKQTKVVLEAARVLKCGGGLHIWDAAFESVWPESFVAELDIDAGGERIHTAYGIIKNDGPQRLEDIVRMCLSAGLRPAEQKRNGEHFYLCFAK